MRFEQFATAATTVTAATAAVTADRETEVEVREIIRIQHLAAALNCGHRCVLLPKKLLISGFEI